MPLDLNDLRVRFANKNYLLTAHASNRAAERRVVSTEIEAAINNGEMIEDYPNDKYGPSCLIMGASASGRILYVQVSYQPSAKVITVDEPSPDEWEVDLKTRKTS